MSTILISMLTPFSHYLQSNQAPSEDEIRKIKALRAIPLEKISVINIASVNLGSADRHWTAPDSAIEP